MAPQIAVIKATLKYTTQNEFIRGMAPLITKRGMFIHTRQTRPVGSDVQFEFSLADGSIVYTGEGVVRKEIPYTENEPIAQKSGMLVALRRVNHAFKDVVDAVLSGDIPEPQTEAQPKPLPSAPISTSASHHHQHIVEAHAGEGFDLFGDLDMDEGLDSLFSSIEKSPTQSAADVRSVIRPTTAESDPMQDIMGEDFDAEEDINTVADMPVIDFASAQGASTSNDEAFMNGEDTLPPPSALPKTDVLDVVSSEHENYFDSSDTRIPAQLNENSQSVTGQFEAVQYIAQAERAVYENHTPNVQNEPEWNPDNATFPTDKATPMSGLDAVAAEINEYDVAHNALREDQNNAYEQPQCEIFAQHDYETQPENEFIEQPADDAYAMNDAAEMPADDAYAMNDAAEMPADEINAADDDLYNTQQQPALDSIYFDEEPQNDAELADAELASIQAETSISQEDIRNSGNNITDIPIQTGTLSGFPASAAEETPSELFAALQDDILALPSSDNAVLNEASINAAAQSSPFEINAPKPFEINSKPFEIHTKPFVIAPHTNETENAAPIEQQPVSLPSAQSALDELLSRPIPKPETVEQPLFGEVDPDSPIAGFNQNAAKRNIDEPATLENLLKRTEIKSKNVVMMDVNTRKATPRKRNANAEEDQPSIPTQKKGGFFSNLFKK